MEKLYKNILSFTFLTISFAMQSQSITIVQADLPVAGTNWIEENDTIATTLFVTPGSAIAQNWNYSSVFQSVYKDTTSYISKTGLPGASSYPGSNVAAYNPADSIAAFFVSNATGFYVDGFYFTSANPNGVVDFTPNLVYVPTPFTYGNTNNSNSTYSFTIVSGGQTYTYVHNSYSQITADAFGSLTTPTGTYPNTLRIKNYTIGGDSIYLFYGTPFETNVYAGGDTTTSYNWLRNNTKAVVMSLSLDASGTIRDGSYLSAATLGAADLEKRNKGLEVYPNPTSDHITFSIKNAGVNQVSLLVYDALGKVVVEKNLNIDGIISNHNINIAELNDGIYVYRLIGEGFNKSGKFIKN